MPLPDLTDDERAELVRLLRDAIAADRYFLSPQVKRLKSILAKVDPASAERTVAPYPAPGRAAAPMIEEDAELALPPRGESVHSAPRLCSEPSQRGVTRDK